MTAGQQMMVARGGGAFVASLANKTADSVGTDNATITVNTDGTITLTATSTTGAENYYLPTTAGIGSTVWARLTRVSGTSVGLVGTAYATWVQVTSNLAWTLQAPSFGLTRSTLLTLEIATSSGGTPVVSATAASGVRLACDNT